MKKEIKKLQKIKIKLQEKRLESKGALLTI